MNKTCERCAKSFTLQPDDSCPENDVNKLAKLVHFCQRCADYGWSRFKYHESIRKNAIALSVMRQKEEPSERDRRTMDKRLKAIQELCRGFAAKICEFYKVQFTWDEAIYDSIVQKPEKTETMLNIYEAGIRQIAQPKTWTAKTVEA